jgi:hypothetical protein
MSLRARLLQQVKKVFHRKKPGDSPQQNVPTNQSLAPAPDDQSSYDFPIKVRPAIKSRLPKLSNPTAPSIVALPPETILQIIEILHDESPQSFRRFGATCSYFYNMVEDMQQSTTSVALNGEGLDCLRKMQEDGAFGSIRKLAVSSFPNPNEHDALDLSVLADAISKMSNLRQLTLRLGVLPDGVLDAVMQRPDIELSVDLSTFRTPTADLVKALESLLETRCPNLVAIGVDIIYHCLPEDPARPEQPNRAPSCTGITRPMKQILLTCPNVRRLSLNIRLASGGGDPPEAPGEYVGFGFAGGQRPWRN